MQEQKFLSPENINKLKFLFPLKKNNQKYYWYAALFLMLHTFLFSCSPYKTLNWASIPGTEVSFCYSEDSLLIIDELIFDTGAELTAITSGETLHFPEKKRCGSIRTIGLEGTDRMEKMFFMKKLFLDSIQVKNVFVVEVDSEHLSPEEKDLLKRGAIGMNIISKADWLIDFKKKTIRPYSHSRNEEIPHGPTVTLSYNNKYYPKTDLLIGGIQIKNVLIDSGASHCLKLPLAYKDSILHQSEIKDSSSVRYFGLYSEKSIVPTTTKYRLKTLRVNDVELDNLWVAFVEDHTSSIGIGFLRHFSTVLIDTKNKTVSCGK